MVQGKKSCVFLSTEIESGRKAYPILQRGERLLVSEPQAFQLFQGWAKAKNTNKQVPTINM